MSDLDLFWKDIVAIQREHNLSSDWGLRTVLKTAVSMILKHGHSDEFLRLLKTDAKQSQERESFRGQFKSKNSVR